MELQRRTALKGGAAAVAGVLTGGPFAGLLAPAGAAAPQAPHRRLRAIPDLRDGQVRLHLPEGFSYRSFPVPPQALTAQQLRQAMNAMNP